MNYLSKKGYVVKKTESNNDIITKIKKELIARPLTDTKFNTNQPFYHVYIETKNKIYIPKMYGIQEFGLPNKFLKNYEGKQWENDIEFKGALFSNQEKLVEALLNACYEKSGGILQAGTGTGKTFCALYVLSKLKYKTIVVVNKISLMKQWENEIARFLPDANVGFIQGQKNIDIHDKDIVIAMLQSMSKIDYPDELFDNFGVTIVDEAHNMSSQSFSKVFFKLCSKYSIGLTATPTRSDGCEYVFKWHLGDIVYQTENNVRMGKQPIIKLLQMNSDEYKEVVITNEYSGESRIQYTSMISELVMMEKRNKLITELIKSCYTEKRKILVLSDRRNHLIILKKILDNDLTVTFTYGLFLGSMKINDLEKSKSCDVILATYSAFGEGISEKDLDTLILTTPKKFIGHLKNKTKNESFKLEQIVGRIFRKEHIERNPVIIDIQDNFSVYRHQNKGRVVFYKQHFKNALYYYESIHLDKYDIKDITTQCITSKNKKENEQEQQDTIIQFNKCIIE
jgi:superfamily II DNA or RNA helicase